MIFSHIFTFNFIYHKIGYRSSETNHQETLHLPIGFLEIEINYNSINQRSIAAILTIFKNVLMKPFWRYYRENIHLEKKFQKFRTKSNQQPRNLSNFQPIWFRLLLKKILKNWTGATLYENSIWWNWYIEVYCIRNNIHKKICSYLDEIKLTQEIKTFIS